MSERATKEEEVKILLICLLTMSAMAGENAIKDTMDWYNNLQFKPDQSRPQFSMQSAGDPKIDSLYPGERCWCGWFHKPIICPQGYEEIYGPTVATYPEQPTYDCRKIVKGTYPDSILKAVPMSWPQCDSAVRQQTILPFIKPDQPRPIGFWVNCYHYNADPNYGKGIVCDTMLTPVDQWPIRCDTHYVYPINWTAEIRCDTSIITRKDRIGLQLLVDSVLFDETGKHLPDIFWEQLRDDRTDDIVIHCDTVGWRREP